MNREIFNISISGTGSYLPDNILTNRDMEMMVDTSDEWIVARSGIKERRVCPRGLASSDMGYRAALKACRDAGISPEELEFIICSTVSADKYFPSTACLIQHKLGRRDIPAFDISAACSGFIYALEVARGFIGVGTYKRGLVVASECMSRLTDYTDRATCVLLGDGAGAAVVERASGDGGLLGAYISADGGYGDLLQTPAGGSRMPSSFHTIENRLNYMKMEGSAIFKVAILTMSESLEKLLERCGLTKEDISLLIPHQANLRIIKGVARNLGLPEERLYINIENYGNMSAACIPVAIDEARRKGLIKKNDIIATVAFGGGLTWGANLIRWTAE